MIQRAYPRLLLVEGKTELRLLPYLLEANGVPWPKGKEPVFIKEMGGFENFWRDQAIHTELKTAALDAVGLIFDADEPEDGRWETVARCCQSFAPDLPNEPQVGGWVTESTVERGPRFGVWMMPDNRNRGYLETFLEVLVPDQALWSYAGEVVTEAVARGATFAKRRRDKAKIHSWLAWQEEPASNSTRQSRTARSSRRLHARRRSLIGFAGSFPNDYERSRIDDGTT